MANRNQRRNQKRKEGIREHFCARLKQRFGITMNSTEYSALNKEVRANSFSHKLTLTRRIVRTEIEGHVVYIIYIRNGGMVTALTEEQFIDPNWNKREEV